MATAGSLADDILCLAVIASARKRNRLVNQRHRTRKVADLSGPLRLFNIWGPSTKALSRIFVDDHANLAALTISGHWPMSQVSLSMRLDKILKFHGLRL